MRIIMIGIAVLRIALVPSGLVLFLIAELGRMDSMREGASPENCIHPLGPWLFLITELDDI